MTREEILAKWDSMTPRERDAWVAEKVMGWKWEKINTYYGKYIIDEYGSVRLDNDWNPSTDISAAWEVVEKMRETHVYQMADYGRNMHKEEPHYIKFHHLNSPSKADDWKPRFKTIPEGICKAALLAVLEGQSHAETTT